MSFRKLIDATFVGLDNISVVILATCLIACPFLLAKLLEPMWPLFTIAFVLLGTGYSFEKRTTAAMTIVGLALYAVSWPIAWKFGPHIAMLAWTPGVFLWMIGVFRPFVCLQRVAAA